VLGLTAEQFDLLTRAVQGEFELTIREGAIARELCQQGRMAFVGKELDAEGFTWWILRPTPAGVEAMKLHRLTMGIT
jgi:hypothetical protein